MSNESIQEGKMRPKEVVETKGYDPIFNPQILQKDNSNR